MALKLSLLFILILSVSCGSPSRKETPVFLKGQITTGIPKQYEDKIGIISSLKRHDLFLDSDRDGIRDRDDFDIDNDGIPNDCDHAPFDITIGSEDADRDNIPDFCDLESGELKTLQEEMFSTYGILLNLNEDFGDNFNPQELRKAAAHIATQTTLPNPLLMTLTLTREIPAGEYGVYDQSWRNIRLKPSGETHSEYPSVQLSTWTLVHELFHFVGASNTELYQVFSAWYKEASTQPNFSYPTEYGKTAEEEYFAELMTLGFFQEDQSDS